MNLVKRFLKILLEELNKIDNNCEESDELGQPRCPPDTTYFAECNMCLGGAKMALFEYGRRYEKKKWIELKNANDNLCPGEIQGGLSYLKKREKTCGNMKYIVCRCITTISGW